MVETRFVCCTGELEGGTGEDNVNHRGPETGGFGVTLQGVADGENVANFNRGGVLKSGPTKF